MKITTLTCTNGRPECEHLSMRWLQHQDYQPDRRIVMRGMPFLDAMRKGLSCVDPDPDTCLVFFEDDDWYSPRWLDRCRISMKLEKVDLFGQRRIFNYHIPSGGFQEVEPKHKNCALHATAMRTTKGMLDALHGVLSSITDHRVDVALWRVGCDKYRRNCREVVSMKGMPGTPGFSLAHQAANYHHFDHDRQQLRYWIGSDADLYAPYYAARLDRAEARH